MVQRLDVVGVDRVVVSDHVVFGEDLGAYSKPELGGLDGGRQPTGPDGEWLEPLTLLALLAGKTKRVRLATGILLAALRRPVVLAKTASTLDVLSRGRLDLGVGVGWQEAEYQAADLDFHARGALLDSSLELCRALWLNQRVNLDVGSVGLDGIHMMPKPVSGSIPIWVSGTVNPAVVRRLARFGVGWIPWGRDAVDLGASIPAMRSALASVGGDASGLQVVGSLTLKRSASGAVLVDENLEAVRRLLAVGVSDVRVRFSSRDLDEGSVELFLEGFRNLSR